MSESVVILGAGAPNGVGGALTRRFADAGHHVFVSGRTLSKVEETAAAASASGGSAEPVAVDVTSSDR